MRREGVLGESLPPRRTRRGGVWGSRFPEANTAGIWGESAGTVRGSGGCPHYLAMPSRGPAGDSRSAKRLTAYHIGRFQVCCRPRCVRSRRTWEHGLCTAGWMG